MRLDLFLFRKNEKKLTQMEMAEKLGISVSNYNLIENGKRRGSLDFWENLQNKFDLADSDVWNMQKNII